MLLKNVLDWIKLTAVNQPTPRYLFCWFVCFLVLVFHAADRRESSDGGGARVA